MASEILYRNTLEIVIEENFRKGLLFYLPLQLVNATVLVH